MSRVNSVLIIVGLLLPLYAQNQIFKTKLQGMEVQEFNPGLRIDSLTVYQSGEWVFMRAWGGGGFGDILGTKLVGSELQGFIPPAGHILSLTASGPDPNGYVYLTASDGAVSQDILRTKLSGTGTQSYSAPPGYCISGFTTSGPDLEGYVYLLARGEAIGVEEKFGQEKGLKLTFELKEMMPNPCYARTRIFYSIAKSCHVKLFIYDPSGRLIKKLIDRRQDPGRYNLSWGAVDEHGWPVPAGIYFVRLEAGDFIKTKKLVLTR